MKKLVKENLNERYKTAAEQYERELIDFVKAGKITQNEKELLMTLAWEWAMEEFRKGARNGFER
jgi:hypothetical protein